MAGHMSDQQHFTTGAYRDIDVDKLDIEAAVSPIVIERYVQYLHKHALMPDGTKRPNDNWQKGIPINNYMKSLVRHFIDVWKIHRGFKCNTNLEDSLCAVLFNTMGYLFEILREKDPEEKAVYMPSTKNLLERK